MSTPRVSVIVPCFNLGQYLDEAVDSVLAQTFRDFEILVVDDGSTDEDTRRRVAGYSRPHTRVVGSPENRGLPAAKNLGLAQTSGEYVCMLDADDRLDRLMVERSVAFLDEHPECAFASHWVHWFGDETKDWTPADCDFPTLLDMNTVNGAALVRRRALDAVGGFDETFRDGCEDWDLWIALVERGFRGRILPEILYHYRRRVGSMSQEMVRGTGHADLYRRIADKHREAFRAHLPALLARRERDIATMRLHTHDLELEHERWLGPEVAKAADDAAMLERLEREHPELTALAIARAESDALRRSLSWRITAPLRAVYDLLGLSKVRRP